LKCHKQNAGCEPVGQADRGPTAVHGKLVQIRPTRSRLLTSPLGREKDAMIISENIYLLGAGFTKAVHSKVPLNYDLLESIITTGAEKLSIYQKKYKTDDIERLLTQVDLDSFADEQIPDPNETNIYISQSSLRR